MNFENMTKKQILKLVGLGAAIIFLTLTALFLIISMFETGEDEDIYEEREMAYATKLSSLDRTEEEERVAVEYNIDMYTRSTNVDITPYSAENDTMIGELPDESYQEYMEQIRLLSRSGKWKDISTLVHGMRGQYTFTKEQKEILYPFLSISDFKDSAYLDAEPVWAAIRDVEVKFYAFIYMPTVYQATMLPSLDVTYLPRPNHGVEIKKIEDENVGWEESNAWKYFSDEEATHIYRAEVEMNGVANDLYYIYYVHNDLLGDFITNIKKVNGDDSTTYKEYMEMNNLEIIDDVY